MPAPFVKEGGQRYGRERRIFPDLSQGYVKINSQIATKLISFNKGVTVTAGLATVFTTPAHGTAFDIVGQGKADPGAIEHALEIAVKLAAARLQ